MGLVFKKSTAQPEFTSGAAITGTAQVGQTLTCAYSVTRARANNVTVEWRSYFDLDRNDLQVVGTGASYTIQGGDNLRYLECYVAATNPAGTVYSTSALSPQVSSGGDLSYPSFDGGASITGVARVGQSLTVTYEVSSSDSETIQWYTYTDGDGGGEQAIGGATAASYTVQAGDEGYWLGAVVTATNTNGSTASPKIIAGAAVSSGFSAPPDAPPNAVAITQTSINESAATLANGGYPLTTAGGYYYLMSDVSFAEAGFYVCDINITLDLNGAVVTFNTSGNDQVIDSSSKVSSAQGGIYFYLDYRDSQNSAIPGRASSHTGFTVKNGSIVAGGNGNYSHCMYARSHSGGTVIDNVVCEAGTGLDAACVYAQDGCNFTIRNSLMVASTSSTPNRHQGPAAIRCGNGTVNITDSVVIGGLSAVALKAGSVLRCFLSHDGFDTNGYGAWVYDGTSVEVQDNVILPVNGRGVLINNGTGHTVSGNAVLHWEKRQYLGEFDDNLNPPAFRIRYNPRNNLVENNTSLGVGGHLETDTPAEERTGASGFYLSCDVAAGSVKNTLRNNTVRTVFYGVPDDLRDYVQPVTLEGEGNGSTTVSNCVIEDNNFYSNHFMLRTNGFDNYCELEDPIAGNSWAWQDGPSAYAAFVAEMEAIYGALSLTAAAQAAADARKASVLAELASLVDDGDLCPLLPTTGTYKRAFLTSGRNPHSGALEYCDLIDSTYGDGVDFATHNAHYQYSNWAGGIAVRDGFTATVQILFNGNPVPFAEVTVTPQQVSTLRSDNDVTTATTDDTGNCTLTFWRGAIVKGLLSSDVTTTQSGTSSVVAVSGLGAATVTHSSIGATITLV